MTFYGLERPIDYGRQLVFDPSTAEMVLNAQRLYANAVYNDYKQGLEDMKLFNEKYGDFQSLIAADQDWWNKNVTGKVRDFIDYAYQNGVDLLRSPQGRAELSRLINSMPYGEMAEKRLSAETAKQYAKVRGELILNGLWNEDMEKYALGGKTLETWDTSKDGVWGRYAPMKALTMDDIIDPLVKDMDPIFDAELTALMNDGYNYSTVSRDRIRKVIDDNMPDLIGAGTAGGYYYNQALQAAGGNKDKAKEILKDWYADRASKRVQMKREADQYKLDTFRTRNDNWLDQQKSARDSYYGLITAGVDTDGNGKISKEERQNYATLMQNSKKYSGDSKNTGENVFRRAERTIDSGSGADYIKSDADYENIQPKAPGITHTINKDGSTYYTIPAGIVGSVLYSHGSVYNNESNSLIRYNEFAQKSGSYYFRPTGTMKAKKIIDSKGVEHTRYFITGTLQHSDFDSDVTDEAGSPKLYEMEVTESVNKHGKNQRKK